MRLLCLLLLLPALAQAEEVPFWIGSYGRIGLTMDGDGARGHESRIVPAGPRLTEGTYIELDLGFKAYEGKQAKVRTVVTTAFGEKLFHLDGDFDSVIALRQAFVEAEKLFGTGAFAWIGSRMYRGDDIYLLDWWPMDDLNTIGATGGWRGPKTEVALHMGLFRLENDFQVQRIPVASNHFGAEEVTSLDRQRSVFAAKAEHRWGSGEQLHMKVKLYSELHLLPKGERAVGNSTTTTEPLPDDLGFMIGAQLGLWNFLKRGHFNLWLRYAKGLAAYDELATPVGLNTDRRAVDAEEYRVAAASNFEVGNFVLQTGGYLRVFFDADGQEEDFDDRQEGAVVLRPMMKWGIFTPAVEGSLQVSRPNGLNPRTVAQETATVMQFGFVPALTFGDDPGSYTRPQLRLIYSVSMLNQGALDLYAEDDPRATQEVVHFVGASAEWWFGRGGGY